MVRLMAPFTPFLTDMIWQNLRHLLDDDADLEKEDSVHYLMMPEAEKWLIDTSVEERVSSMQAVVEIGRILRDRKTLPIKYPLKELVVIHRDPHLLDGVNQMKPYILDELNIRDLIVTTDQVKWGVTLKAELDFKTLGARLKADLKAVMAAVKNLTEEQLTNYISTEKITVLGHELTGTDLHVSYSLAESTHSDRYIAHSDGKFIVLLDTSADQSMQDEGLAREITNRVQKLRKKAKLVPEDAVTLYCRVTPEDSETNRVIVEHLSTIASASKTPIKLNVDPPTDGRVVIKESTAVKGSTLQMAIIDDRPAPVQNGCVFASEMTTPISTDGLAYVKVTSPKSASAGVPPKTILLEQPKAGANRLSYHLLIQEVRIVFNLWDSKRLMLSVDSEGKEPLRPTSNLLDFSGKMLFIVRNFQ